MMKICVFKEAVFILPLKMSILDCINHPFDHCFQFCNQNLILLMFCHVGCFLILIINVVFLFIFCCYSLLSISWNCCCILLYLLDLKPLTLFILVFKFVFKIWFFLCYVKVAAWNILLQLLVLISRGVEFFVLFRKNCLKRVVIIDQSYGINWLFSLSLLNFLLRIVIITCKKNATILSLNGTKMLLVTDYYFLNIISWRKQP